MYYLHVAEFLRARLLCRSNRRLSRTEFERRRLHRFRTFVSFVHANSPYYRRIIQTNNIDPANCTPEEFPVLTKSELVRHFNDIITVRGLTYQEIAAFLHTPSPPETLLRNRYVVMHTSGSSGEVGFFIYDSKAWAHAIAQLSRAKGFTLFAPRRRRIGYIGAIQGHFAGVSSVSSVRAFPLNLFYELRAFEVNRPLREAVVGFNSFKPHIIAGYGTALKALAEKQIDGELNIKPDVVTNSGEPITATDKQVIERAFGKCIRNFYSCSEHMFMGLKEAWQDSMCLFEDELIFDIQRDHLLVTNIFNRTLPLIRYRMSDILTPLATSEHSPYQAIAEVAGRVESMAKFKNRHGDIDGISPHTINEILIPHVRQFQLRLRGLERFEFAIVLEDAIDEGQKQLAVRAARATLQAILAEKAMDNVSFDITPLPTIAVDSKTGKFRLIVNASDDGGRSATDMSAGG
jgi:phenylacetate-coenzyme A ligase PaaK-like adenylate-forming protein